MIDFVNIQGYAVDTLILSVSLVLWCNNVMIKHTVGLLKQLLCFLKFVRSKVSGDTGLEKHEADETCQGREDY